MEAEEWRSDEGRYEGIRRAKWCPKLGRVGARTARRSVKFPNFRGIRAGKRVTGAKRVESRAKGTSFCLTVPTLSRPLSLSLPASPFNSPFNSSLVFFSYSFSLSLSLFDFALSFSVYAHRSSHLRPSLDSFLFPTAAAHPPHDFAGVLTGSSISTWTYGKLVETLLGSVFQGGGISSAFSGARSIGRN